MRWCKICAEVIFNSEPHTCPPKWLVWCPEWGGTREGAVLRYGRTVEDAVERWAVDLDVEGRLTRWDDDAIVVSAQAEGADLRGADIDYAAGPLWRGSRGVRVDDRILRQLAAHLCAVEVDSEEGRAAQQAILEYAIGSHRARDLGLIGGK